MNELLGSGTLREGELAFPTVNGYAYYYYKMAAILRISAKALAVLPSLYGRGKASGVKRWREFSHPATRRL